MNASLPYDVCYDCGAPMTAAKEQPAPLTIIDENGNIDSVYISCDGCGSRAGHRIYNEDLH